MRLIVPAHGPGDGGGVVAQPAGERPEGRRVVVAVAAPGGEHGRGLLDLPACLSDGVVVAAQVLKAVAHVVEGRAEHLLARLVLLADGGEDLRHQLVQLLAAAGVAAVGAEVDAAYLSVLSKASVLVHIVEIAAQVDEARLEVVARAAAFLVVVEAVHLGVCDEQAVFVHEVEVAVYIHVPRLVGHGSRRVGAGGEGCGAGGVGSQVGRGRALRRCGLYAREREDKLRRGRARERLGAVERGERTGGEQPFKRRSEVGLRDLAERGEAIRLHRAFKERGHAGCKLRSGDRLVRQQASQLVVLEPRRHARRERGGDERGVARVALDRLRQVGLAAVRVQPADKAVACGSGLKLRHVGHLSALDVKLRDLPVGGDGQHGAGEQSQPRAYGESQAAEHQNQHNAAQYSSFLLHVQALLELEVDKRGKPAAGERRGADHKQDCAERVARGLGSGAYPSA